MTEFRQHDRLQVVNAKRRGIDPAPVLKKGQIVTASSVKDQTVILEGVSGWFFANRFQLVEHAVCSDRNGVPLYSGDRVRRIPGGGQDVGYEGKVVKATATGIRIDRDGFESLMNTTPKYLELVHHHWEPAERVVLGFDGTEEGHPFVVIGYMDDGGAMKIHPPRITPELVEQFEEQARRWSHRHWGFSNHALGSAVDVPVQLNWDDVVIGSVVQVRVRTTGEQFTAEVTESPNGTKKSHEPSPHVHGLWTGSSIVRKHWELLRNDLPVPPLPRSDGSIVAPANDYDRSRAHRIGGRWLFAGGSETDPTNWPKGFRIVRDAEKED